MKRLALLLACSCLCACKTGQWQDYDESSYAAVMDPSEEVVAKHVAVLEHWVDGPEADVPPGMYAELAYWLAKTGHTEEARKLFGQEIERYPYAQKYIQLLMALVLPAVAVEPKTPPANPAEPKP